MRLNLFFILIMISSLAKAEIIFESDKNTELSLNDSTPIVNPTVSKSSSKLEIIEEQEDISFYLYWNKQVGKMYFAPGSQIDMEFNSVQFVKSKHFKQSNFFYDLELNHMFNESKAKFIGAVLSLGYEVKLVKNLSWKPNAGLGLTYYQEKSAVQNINDVGTNLQLRSGFDYKVSESFGIGINAQWNHLMYSKNYWPKDLATELVLEYTTFGVGVIWELK